MSIAHSWNTTDDERARPYPCDGVISGKTAALYRAIDVDAPASLVFRWLCQLRVAPYSYDWIDNFGRRSPQQLTPGLDALEVGQRAMRLFEVVSFERDRQITAMTRGSRLARALFGDIAATYGIAERGAGVARIAVKVVVRYPHHPGGWLMRLLLPWGDLIMMRKQLLNLKHLAEHQARNDDVRRAVIDY